MGHATVEELQGELDGYLREPNDFYKVMNQILPRVYAKGDWPGLLFETSLTVGTSGTISLPDDSISVVFAVVDNDPRVVRSIWHDYNILGVTSGAGALYGLVDDGIHATSVPLNADYHFLMEFSPLHSGETFVGDEVFRVRGESWDGEQIYESVTPSAASTLVQLTNAALKRIESVSYKNVTIDTTVTAVVVEVGTFTASVSSGTISPISGVTNSFTDSLTVSGTTDLFDVKTDPVSFTSPSTWTIGSVTSSAIGVYSGPAGTITAIPVAFETNNLDTNSIVVGKINGQTAADGSFGSLAYRVYRVAEADTSGGEIVRMLLKRKHKRIVRDEDVVFVDNLSALKHAMLGLVAEDNADTDRSVFHWNKCWELFDDELRDYHKSAKPIPEIKPFGDVHSIPALL